MVGSLRKLNHRKFSPKEVKFRDYFKYNIDTLVQQLTAVDWSIIYDCENVDNCAELLTDIVEKHFNENALVISKRVKGRLCPWLDADLKNRMNARDKMYRKASKSKNEEDWNRYKQLRNKCINELRYAKNRYYEVMLNENKADPSNFWSIIREYFQKHNHLIVIVIHIKKRK